jgi:hypothetical protein
LGALTSLIVAYSIKFLHFPNVPQQSVNLQGTFLNGSQLGHYLFFVVFLMLPLRLFGPADLKKQGMIPTMLLIAVSMLLASKRSAMAACGFLVVLMIFYNGFVRRQFAKAVALVAVGSVCLAALYFIVFHGLLDPEESAHYLERAEAIRTGGTDSAFWNDNMQSAVDCFRESPLTGVGLGLGTVETTGAIDHELHSTFFKFLGDGGALMVLTGLWLLISMGMMGARYRRFLPLAHLTLVNAYRVAYLSVFVLNFWGYSIRRREFWFAIAIVEAMKAISARAPGDTDLLEKPNEERGAPANGQNLPLCRPLGLSDPRKAPVPRRRTSTAGAERRR